MNAILVADPESSERARLGSGLSSFGRTIIVAPTLEDALASADGSTVSFAVVGIIDPGALPASESIERVLRGGQTGFLLAAADPTSLPELTLGSSFYLDRRPVSISRLQVLLRRHVRSSITRMPMLTMADLVQMACLGGHSLTIVCSKEKQDIGSVDIIQGELWTARDEQGEGPDALQRLMLPGVVARGKPLLGSTAGPRTVFQTWQEALLEAARQTDERSRIAPEDELQTLISQASKALLERDHKKAGELFQRAARLDPRNTVIRVNLQRLRALGYIPLEDE
ncbi:MAG: DUF4388 domain-containing protein [Polyangiaceae bacterium]|nr:DUF4388 domain-containing protein [Polyangiaceae bacterium]